MVRTESGGERTFKKYYEGAAENILPKILRAEYGFTYEIKLNIYMTRLGTGVRQ